MSINVFSGRAVAVIVAIGCAAAVPAFAQDAGTPSDTRPATASPVAEPAATDASATPVAPTRPALGRYVAPTIGLRETFSNNATFGTGAASRNGLVSDLTAALALGIVAPEFRASGRFQVDGYAYAPEHDQDRVIPYGQLDGTWEPLPNRAYLDAGVVSSRVVQSPYGVVSAVGPTGSSSTLTQLRLGPRVEGELEGDRHYMVRSLNGWSTPVSGAAGASATRPGSYTSQNIVELEQRPVPLGAAINLEDDLSHYNAPIATTLRDATARLILRYRLAPQLLVGLHGGGERLSYTIDGRDQGRVLGADIAWRPTERTSLVGFGESRFFGPVWDAALHHRTGFLALDVTGYRRTTTAPQSLLSLSGIGDLQRIVEAIYVARYPDQAERARAVDALLAQTGTPAAGAVNVYSPDLALQTSAAATIGYLGPRDVASLSVSNVRHNTLDIGGVPGSFLQFSAGSYRDTHVALTLSHRLQPLTTLTFRAAGDQVWGLESASSSHGRTRLESLDANQQVSPRLDVLVGMLHQSAGTALVPGINQTAVYAGLLYRL